MMRKARSTPLSDPAPLALTSAQAARALGIGKRALFRLIRARRLHAVRLGRAFRIPPWALEDFLAGREGKRPRA